MNASSPACALDALLPFTRTPSIPAWQRLCARLDLGFDAALVPSLGAALVAWPDALRVLPGRWFRALLHGVEHPALPLVTTVRAQLFAGEVPHRFAWARCEGLRNVTAFHLRDEGLGDVGAAALADAPHLTRLRALSLSYAITASGARSLAAAPALRGLDSLDLARNELMADGVDALAGSDSLSRLRAIHLGRNRLGEDAARLIGRSAWRPSLLDLDANQLDGAAVTSLCSGDALRGVTTLNLSNNPIGRAGCEALAATRLDALEVLYLHRCDLTDDDAAPLWRAPWLAGLANLALSANRLGATTLDALATHDALRGLRELDVCSNAVDVDVARARLGGAESLRGVTRLCV